MIYTERKFPGISEGVTPKETDILGRLNEIEARLAINPNSKGLRQEQRRLTLMLQQIDLTSLLEKDLGFSIPGRYKEIDAEAGHNLATTFEWIADNNSLQAISPATWQKTAEVVAERAIHREARNNAVDLLSEKDDRHFAFLAGLLEHQGSLNMGGTGSDRTTDQYPRMIIQDRRKAKMEELQSLFGGHIYEARDPRSSENSQSWALALTSGYQNAAMAARMMPFTVSRQETYLQFIRWAFSGTSERVSIAEATPLKPGPVGDSSLYDQLLLSGENPYFLTGLWYLNDQIYYDASKETRHLTLISVNLDLLRALGTMFGVDPKIKRPAKESTEIHGRRVGFNTNSYRISFTGRERIMPLIDLSRTVCEELGLSPMFCNLERVGWKSI
ncbi:hypothetical protein GYA49_00915 [Candidatus Beckwithbacteria bacterium]|nr:hypothetical protein [Candidatus Beckwithbacteria bacterium]